MAYSLDDPNHEQPAGRPVSAPAGAGLSGLPILDADVTTTAAPVAATPVAASAHLASEPVAVTSVSSPAGGDKQSADEAFLRSLMTEDAQVARRAMTLLLRSVVEEGTLA